MSKLSEYLALVPKGFKNFGSLVEGITNQVRMELGSLPQAHEDEIVRRRLICATCPFMSFNAVAAGIYTTQRTDAHCMHCGCPILTRTASLESDCGLENYNLTNIDNQIPLKWEKYTDDESKNQTTSTD